MWEKNIFRPETVNPKTIQNDKRVLIDCAIKALREWENEAKYHGNLPDWVESQIKARVEYILRELLWCKEITIESDIIDHDRYVEAYLNIRFTISKKLRKALEFVL